MARRAVEVVVAGEDDEVVHRLRRLGGVERHGEGALVGLDRGGVRLRRVDAQLGAALKVCVFGDDPSGLGHSTVPSAGRARGASGTVVAPATVVDRWAAARGGGGGHGGVRRGDCVLPLPRLKTQMPKATSSATTTHDAAPDHIPVRLRFWRLAAAAAPPGGSGGSPSDVHASRFPRSAQATAIDGTCTPAGVPSRTGTIAVDLVRRSGRWTVVAPWP